MGEEVKQVVASLGYDRAQDLVGRYDLLEQIAAHDKIDLAPLITPLEEFLDLEPIDLPVAESRGPRAEAGLVVARPIRMEAKQASTQIAALAGDICSGRTIRNEFPRATDANDRVLGTELAGAIARSRIFEDGPESNDEVLASLEFNGGSVAGQGLGAFNAYGVSIRDRGRRPGRRRQDDAGRLDRDPQGQGRQGQAPQRLGRQVLRLRRPARPPLRPGLGRLALLHPPLRRRRGPRRRARRGRSTTAAAASSTAPTPRASPSST